MRAAERESERERQREREIRQHVWHNELNNVIAEGTSPVQTAYFGAKAYSRWQRQQAMSQNPGASTLQDHKSRAKAIALGQCNYLVKRQCPRVRVTAQCKDTSQDKDMRSR